MDQARRYLRAAFKPEEVVDVTFYGGQFSAQEVGQLGFKTPALLVAGLGWSAPRSTDRLAGKRARAVHMAVFVVTGTGTREERMLEAQLLAERVDALLVDWSPVNAPDQAAEVAAPEPGVRCENVYNRAVDAKGLALWLVTWRQCVKANQASPQTYELLGIDIVSHVRTRPVVDQVDSDAVVPVTYQIDIDQIQG